MNTFLGHARHQHQITTVCRNLLVKHRPSVTTKSLCIKQYTAVTVRHQGSWLSMH